MGTELSLVLLIAAGLLVFWIALKILKKILIALLICLLVVAAGILLHGTLW